jgi:adenine-specific DNA-methyltransferase
MSQKYEKLKNLLKELFQLDQPDLDFGLYRIMHAKSAEVTQFLDKDLLPQVKKAFSLYKTADKAELDKELAKAIEQAQALGADPESLPKVKELRAKLANEAVDVGTLENEVYDHLYSFFRRYYSEGDFLAKRVYKPGVYSIPYEGEEVKLHWANKDQYYIKTSEYLRDYAFRLRPEDDANPMRGHFRLEEVAEGEHGNVKAAEGKERVFILAPNGESGRDFLSLEDGQQGQELIIRFEYRPANLGDWPEAARGGKTNPPSQKELLSFAAADILGTSDGSFAIWLKELSKTHVTTSGEKADYNRLEAHLRRYSARNTFDYFIHKDLGGFLRRELDFYIKNEVMHLDDVENEAAPRVEQFLSKVKVIRVIAKKVIDFLSQLEDFQKKLWLKKKFVVETAYCVPLNRIPEEFYSEVAANQKQREEWVALCAIDGFRGDLTTPAYSVPLTVPFLNAHPTLVVDTRHFTEDFTDRLLHGLGDLDTQIDAVLIQSENFQALSLLRERYRESLKAIYIDPPYNTDAGPIDYKNGYRSSSWITLIQNRLAASRDLLADDGILCVTIDDYQVHELAILLDDLFGRDNQLGTAIIRNNPSGRSTVRGLSVCHEYAFFYRNGEASLARLPRSEKQLERFTQEGDVYVDWRNFRKDGGAVTHRAERPKQFYPIYVNTTKKTLRVPALQWNRGQRSWDVLENPADNEVAVWPIDEKGQERVWSLNHLSALENLEALAVRPSKIGAPQVYRRHTPSDGVLPRSWWDKNTYAAREYGSATLTQLFGASAFSFAKSPYAVQDSLWVSGLADESDQAVLDYFAGSGTTGHAVINMNREDGGGRKFILVEVGDYFNTVLLPRIKKVVFTPEWKDGKPKRTATQTEVERSPRIIKCIRLESFEDTLNNLEMQRSTAQQSLLGTSTTPGSVFSEEYILKYMLTVETRSSPSILNVAAFKDPMRYQLKSCRPGADQARKTNVDLLETFNWLLGLKVNAISLPQTLDVPFARDPEKRLMLAGKLKPSSEGWWFRFVEGTTPKGLKALIVWRKLTGDLERDNLVLDAYLKDRLKISTKDFEFDLIYVNGDNNLENLKLPNDTWKVRLIEEEFHRLMFDTEGL